MEKIEKKKIELCFSPVLYPYYKNTNAIVVIIDILRASTSICTAFMNGAKSILPVGSLEIAKDYKAKGYTVASERDGIAVDFADFGNSPHNFTKERVENKTIVYSTTNGTKAIEITKDCYAVVIGSFLNLTALANWIIKENKDVVIFCAGWKNKFNLEDSIFGGALVEKLEQSKMYDINCDSAMAACDLWNIAKKNMPEYSTKFAWIKRLKLQDVLEYCLQIDTTSIVPILKDNEIKKS